MKKVLPFVIFLCFALALLPGLFASRVARSPTVLPGGGAGGVVDISDETNLTTTDPITLTGDDLGFNTGWGAVLGSLDIGSGVKHDGYIVTNAAEVQTANAVQTTLDTVALLDENTYHIEAYIVGVQDDGTDRASYHIAATVYRTAAGGATLQGGVTSFHTQESNAALDATFTVNANDVRVSVTGIAAENWEWGCTIKYINMSET